MQAGGVKTSGGQLNGKFITLEGCEGVGKSTNLQFIADTVSNRGIEVVATREPGGTALAEKIRSLLLTKSDQSDEPVYPDTELLMMFAARAQHLQHVILPAIDSGKWVISDRFTHATYAYQGYGRGVSLNKIMSLETMVQASFRPDLTLLLDMPIEKGMERVRQRAEVDRFESEKLDFFAKVREGYLAMASNLDYMHKVDADQSLESVQAQIKKHLNLLFQDVLVG